MQGMLQCVCSATCHNCEARVYGNGLRALRFQGNNSRRAQRAFMSQAVDRSVCRVNLRPGRRSAKAASACFGARGMNDTVFEPSRQTGACGSAEHQVAEGKDSLHDQQTRLLDEADAKVQTENQARRFTPDFFWCTRQSWQASSQN